MSTVLTTITSCNHCGQKFAGGEVLIGEPVAMKVMRFAGKLADHLGKHHPDKAQEMYQASAEFNGYLLLRNFESTDPDFQQIRDQVRVKYQQMTRKASLTDEQLHDKVFGAPLASVDVSVVMSLLKSVRDHYEERIETPVPESRCSDEKSPLIVS